jgi:hypothetical protein
MDRTQPKSRAPLRTLCSAQHAAVLGSNVMLIAGSGVCYYLTSGYMPTFLKLVKEVPNSTASLILIGGSIATIIAQTGAGHLSESSIDCAARSNTRSRWTATAFQRPSSGKTVETASDRKAQTLSTRDAPHNACRLEIPETGDWEACIYEIQGGCAEI